MRTRMTQEQKLQVWRTQIGLEEECVCPGCLVMRMSRKKPTTWQICHVEACSKGGTLQMYNVFIMCKVCNDAQATQNLYAYLYKRGNLRGLHLLIKYVVDTLQHQYTELWRECEGLFHLVAKRLLVNEDVEGTGKLHPKDPVIREFILYDVNQLEHDITVLQEELRDSYERLARCTQNRVRVQGLPPLTRRTPATPPEHLSLGLS